MILFPFKLALYLFYVPFAVLGSLIAIIFAPIICLFVDQDGHLPKLLKWFETNDSTMYDEMWVAEHPTWSKYLVATTWCMRNPFYRGLAALGTSDNSTALHYGGFPDDGQGRSGVMFLLTRRGTFQLKIVMPIGFGKCIRHESGWQLKTPTHATYGMMMLLPIGFYSFGGK